MKNKNVIIDGIEYQPIKQGDIKIVILQRGWVMVGKFEMDNDYCKLYDASVIRVWGTTKGLGELAANGPLTNTKLDKCNGIVEFHYLTVIAMISCDETKWQKL